METFKSFLEQSISRHILVNLLVYKNSLGREKYPVTYGGEINNQGWPQISPKEQLMSGYSRKFVRKQSMSHRL